VSIILCGKCEKCQVCIHIMRSRHNVTFYVHCLFDSSFFFGGAKQPKSDLGHLIVEVSTSHTIKCTCPVGLLCMCDQLIAEAATYRTRNKHNIRTHMTSAGFEPAIPAIKGTQTYALESKGTRIGLYLVLLINQRL
jgi:hypothetical protein